MNIVCFIRGRHARFERFYMNIAWFDERTLLPWMAALICGGSAVFFVAGVRSFARFDEGGVEIGRPLAFRSTYYGHDRIKAIEHWARFKVPIGMTIEHHVIVFDDGSSWSTRDAFRDPVQDLDEQISQLVSHQSGRPIVEHP
jgi:hypothetical protein